MNIQQSKYTHTKIIIIPDDSQDTFRELGGVDLLVECLSKHKVLSSETIACLTKVVKGNSKSKTNTFLKHAIT